jgi:hypothetical protein
MLFWQELVGTIISFLATSISWLSFISLGVLLCLQHTKIPGAYCLGIFKNQDPTTLLGGGYLRMHVDMEQLSTMGLLDPTRCHKF